MSRAGHEGDMHGHLTMPKARKVSKAKGMKSKEHTNQSEGTFTCLRLNSSSTKMDHVYNGLKHLNDVKTK